MWTPASSTLMERIHNNNAAVTAHAIIGMRVVGIRADLRGTT